MDTITVPAPPTCRRGTSNSNARGSSAARARRRAWLIETYRADVDGMWWTPWSWPGDEDAPGPFLKAVELGTGFPVCRCYRCGCLLDDSTVTVDRIKPGCQGGTYRRQNIRPACGPCNSETGGRTRR